jgi:hypothetical protein
MIKEKKEINIKKPKMKHNRKMEKKKEKIGEKTPSKIKTQKL